MDIDTAIILAIVGIGGLAAMSDPARTAEILRAVVDAILRRRNK